MPVLYAIVYGVYRCGFYPVTALNEDDATEQRLRKIEKLIASCRYGIHDISRTEVGAETKLPRFNMPLELGIFLGAKRFGQEEQKKKSALVFDVEKFRYQQFISDLNGIDIKAHKGDPLVVLRELRHWLRTASNRITIPGDIRLEKDYHDFLEKLPLVLSKMELDGQHLCFTDYCGIVEEAIRIQLSK